MLKYRKKIDEKLAQRVVRYLIKTSITPNQVTTVSLLLAAFAAVFFTFGIYFFWVIPSLNKWVVEHTDFADEAKPEGDLV